MSHFGWTEHDQLRAFYADGDDLNGVIELGRRSGYTEAQIRKIVLGGYLRGVAASWDVLHETKSGGRVVRQLLDRDSVVIEEPPMLCIGHDYTDRVGTITTTRLTDYGLLIEAHVDPDHVDEVERLLPAACRPASPASPARTNGSTATSCCAAAPASPKSASPPPRIRSATTSSRLYTRSEHDEWYDQVRLEQIEARVTTHAPRRPPRRARHPLTDAEADGVPTTTHRSPSSSQCSSSSNPTTERCCSTWPATSPTDTTTEVGGETGSFFGGNPARDDVPAVSLPRVRPNFGL